MQMNEYQDYTASQAKYPGAMEGGIDAVIYTTLGLAGEAGEVPNKVKKILRDNNGEITPEVRSAILGELGDVLWYVARLADELDITLEEVAQYNEDKLDSRLARGVIGGSGDDR